MLSITILYGYYEKMTQKEVIIDEFWLEWHYLILISCFIRTSSCSLEEDLIFFSLYPIIIINVRMRNLIDFFVPKNHF
jgi:hypothetical protein